MPYLLFGGAKEKLFRAAVLFGLILHIFFENQSGQVTIDQIGWVFTWLMLALACFLTYLGVQVVLSNRRNYAQFFALYPELKSQIGLLEQEAAYLDETAGLAIFDGYLISYRQGPFAFVPLAEVESLEATYYMPTLKSLPRFYLKVDFLTQEKPVRLYFKKGWAYTSSQESTLALYHYLGDDFPAIHCQ